MHHLGESNEVQSIRLTLVYGVRPFTNFFVHPLLNVMCDVLTRKTLFSKMELVCKV